MEAICNFETLEVVLVIHSPLFFEFRYWVMLSSREWNPESGRNGGNPSLGKDNAIICTCSYCPTNSLHQQNCLCVLVVSSDVHVLMWKRKRKYCYLFEVQLKLLKFVGASTKSVGADCAVQVLIRVEAQN